MVQIDSVSRDYPVEHIKLHIDAPDLDFVRAKDLAKEKAAERCKDSMLLSWYDDQTGEFYPRFECGTGNTPPWIVFAESRGANLFVDINDGTYIFIFLRL